MNEKSRMCECHANTWRRASNDGDDDDEPLENASGQRKQKNNVLKSGSDSGCDSDCAENISELCKKFDENLSEQDVSDSLQTPPIICPPPKNKKNKQQKQKYSRTHQKISVFFNDFSFIWVYKSIIYDQYIGHNIENKLLNQH